jgi:hypothetical protein
MKLHRETHYQLDNRRGRCHMTVEKDKQRARNMPQVQELTATTPQVKQLTVKQAATHTQPYPPLGGASSSALVSSVEPRSSVIFGRR